MKREWRHLRRQLAEIRLNIDCGIARCAGSHIALNQRVSTQPQQITDDQDSIGRGVHGGVVVDVEAQPIRVHVSLDVGCIVTPGPGHIQPRRQRRAGQSLHVANEQQPVGQRMVVRHGETVVNVERRHTLQKAADFAATEGAARDAPYEIVLNAV